MTTPAAVSCLVYDLDGTLIDSVTDIAAAVNRVRGHFGLPALADLAVRPLIGDGAGKLLQRAVFGLCENPRLRPERCLPKSGATLEEVLEMFVSTYNEDPVIKTALYPGAEIIVRFWRREGTFQAVLTNKPHHIAEQILERLEIKNLFDLIVGQGRRDDDGKLLPQKPDPANIDFILLQSGAPREETWMIGDGLPDAATARAAGLRFVPILGGYSEPERLLAEAQDLDLAVTTLKDADQLLRRLTGLGG